MNKGAQRAISALLERPSPLRSAAVKVIRDRELGGYEQRVALGAVERPHYGYCVYHAARLARALGYERISVVEFGVAGGSGLLNLEYHASNVSQLLDIGIDVYGFDTGRGLPEPVDYRDLPYHWKESFFAMDVERLQSSLSFAKLVLGDVRDTAETFFEEHDPAPIAAVMHDFDYYSSTVAALRMFEADDRYFLPRIYCYFDDVIGSEVELYSDYTGVRLAINEFNEAHKTKKLGKAYHLLARRRVETWYHQIFVYHDFEHPRYDQFISEADQQLILRGPRSTA